MKIYTRSGDDGSTSLTGGIRTSKDSLRVTSYGEVDEINSVLGLSLAFCEDPTLKKWLEKVQNELFILQAYLADPTGKTKNVTQTSVDDLEEQCDFFDGELPELTKFILPGGGKCGSFLHLSRSVCRRAERALITLSKEENIDPLAIKYLNRLSDALFNASRYANFIENYPETNPSY